MKRVVNIIFGLSLLALFAALLPLNHDKIPLRWWSGWETHLPLTVLLLFTLLIGMASAVVLILAHRLITVLERRQREWAPRQQRKARKLLQLGANELKKGDESDAERAFREALKLSPRFAESYKALGRLYIMQGKKAEALIEFMRAAALEPDDVQVKIEVAQISLETDDWAKAIKALEDTVKIEPDHPIARRLTPLAFAETARWEEAVEAQDRLIKSLSKELRPPEEERLGKYRTEYARSLVGVDSKKSGKILADVLRKTPDFLPAALTAAEMQMTKDKPKRAYDILAEAFRLRPEPFLFERLLQIEGEHFFERTQELIEETLKVHPRHHALRIARAKGLIERNLAKVALDEIGKISGDPRLELLLIEAAARLKLGEVNEASIALNKAIEAMSIEYKCSVCGQCQRRWSALCTQCGSCNTITAGPFE